MEHAIDRDVLKGMTAGLAAILEKTGQVIEDDGRKYILLDEGSVYERITITPGNGDKEGDVVAITDQTKSYKYDAALRTLTQTTMGIVHRVAFENASITGEGAGFATMGSAIDAAAKSATEEANKLDKRDNVEDINIDMSFSCRVTAYATYMTDCRNVMSVTLTSPLEIGTRYCDEKAVERAALRQLDMDLKDIGDDVKVLDMCASSQVLYKYSIDYKKYVPDCGEKELISEIIYKAVEA